MTSPTGSRRRYGHDVLRLCRRVPCCIEFSSADFDKRREDVLFCGMQMSQSFLGKQIDGVWHTGVVCFGKEFFFGGGIQHDVPGRTPYGVPVQRQDLGETHIPEDVFIEFLQEISSRFSMESYDLLHNNCNNFSNECSIFLTGAAIPEYITSLPSEVLNTPLGESIQ